MTQNAIDVVGLSKAYRISRDQGAQTYRTLQESIVNLVQSPFRGRRGRGKTTFWALDDVSFSVPHGEALGIIGRNGAGKSTLLKLLARITRPTRGSADIYGRVGSLLEVGTGFHSELTGRENIYLNGAILGMSRAHVRRRFDEIVAFAEIGEFLDTPVKRYSSGMYMRLAFAVAAHLEPEILIVDEVLAVGDAAFQAKSLGKMSDVAHSGRTVLFVSHNLAAVTQLCQKGLLLERGKVTAYGSAADVVGQYLALGNREGQIDLDSTRKSSLPPVRLVSARMLDGAGEVRQKFSMGSDITVAFVVASADAQTPVKLSMSVKTSDGLLISHTVDDDASFSLPLGSTLQEVRVRIPDVRLYPGSYQISLYIQDGSNTISFDQAENCLMFDITDGGRYTFRPLPRQSGLLFLTPDWTAAPVSDGGVPARREA